MTIFTSEFVATQPKATITIVYPDGVSHTLTAMAGPYGHAVSSVYCAAFLGFKGHADKLTTCARWADTIRDSHRRAGSEWARGSYPSNPPAPIAALDWRGMGAAVDAFEASKLGRK